LKISALSEHALVELKVIGNEAPKGSANLFLGFGEKKNQKRRQSELK
jgi:hypothetical protein